MMRRVNELSDVNYRTLLRMHTVYSIPYCNTQHYTATRYTTLHRTVPHYTTPHCTTPHCTTLHYTTLHYTKTTPSLLLVVRNAHLAESQAELCAANVARYLSLSPSFTPPRMLQYPREAFGVSEAPLLACVSLGMSINCAVTEYLNTY